VARVALPASLVSTSFLNSAYNLLVRPSCFEVDALTECALFNPAIMAISS
jgi:hypothetical protein